MNWAMPSVPQNRIARPLSRSDTPLIRASTAMPSAAMAKR